MAELGKDAAAMAMAREHLGMELPCFPPFPCARRSPPVAAADLSGLAQRHGDL
jgi:hypothetical protein